MSCAALSLATAAATASRMVYATCVWCVADSAMLLLPFCADLSRATAAAIAITMACD